MGSAITAVTLRDLIATDIASVVLNTDEFAEQVEYRPLGDSSRTVIAAIVANRMTLEENDTGFEEQVETLTVRVLRDKSHAKGGIDLPRIGDQILRLASYDPDGRPYLYAAQQPVIHPAFWDLVYERRKLTADGTDR